MNKRTGQHRLNRGLTLRSASVLFFFCLLIISGCSVFDESEKCAPESIIEIPQVEFHFTYFKNMAYADGFSRNVHCLGAYIFDSEEKLVLSLTEPDEQKLTLPDYRMKTELPAGEYTVVAYGGMECEDADFEHIPQFKETGMLSDLKVELKMDDQGTVSRELHKHFYGKEKFIVEESGAAKVSVDLMRNTNDIQVALMHISQSAIDHNDFLFEIIDDNNSLDEYNRLNKTGEITYLPHNVFTRTADIQETSEPGFDSLAEASQGIAAVASFSVSKLETGSNPLLRVNRADTGETVFKVSLFSYLYLFMTEREGIDNEAAIQDYLDRENRWQLLFFLDDQTGSWIDQCFQVQDWFVRRENIGM